MDTRLTADVPSEETPPTRWRDRVGTALLWAMPIATALCDTAVMAMAMKDMEENNTDTVTVFALLSGISLFTFIQSMALSGPSTVGSFKETVKMCRERKLPDDKKEWPDISKNQEIASVCLAGSITLFATAADFAASYYFISKTPDDYSFTDKINLVPWMVFSVCMGSVNAFTTIFTEGTSTYKLIRQKISNQSLDNPHPHRKLISKIIGYPIAILGAVENAIEAYSSIKNSLALSTTIAKYGTLVACAPKGFSDFCFAGIICVNAIEASLERMYHGKPEKQEVIALLIALGTSVLVVSPQPALTAALMTDPRTSLPFDSPQALTLSLGYGVLLRDGIVQAYTLYPLCYGSTKWLEKQMRQLLHYLSECCLKPKSDLEESLLTEEPINQSLQNDWVVNISSPSSDNIHSKNKSILFQPNSAKVSSLMANSSPCARSAP